MPFFKQRNRTTRLLSLFPTSLYIAVFSFIAVFLSISIFKYHFLLFEGYDLAIYNQLFWNTLHGTPFWITVTFPHSFLADHVGIWSVLILPVYALFPHPMTLVTMQIIATGLAAFPLYLIAINIWNKTNIKNSKITDRHFGLGVASLWLLNPFVHNFTLFEFHFLAFFTLFIFIAFYSYLKKKKWLFLFAIIMATTTREDTGLALSGFIIIMIYDYFKAKLATEKKNIIFYIISTFSAIVIWTIFVYWIINMNSETGGTRYTSHYSWLGSNAFEILKMFITQPGTVLAHLFSLQNINVFAAILLPLFFLPLYSARYGLLSIVPLFAIFFLNNSIDHVSTLKVHYIATVIPGVILATAESFARFAKKHTYHITILLTLILTITTFYAGYFLGPFSRSNLEAIREKIASRKPILEQLNTLKPSETVLASTYLLPKLSSAKNVYDSAQIIRGVKEFTNIKYDLPCNVQTFYLDATEIAYSIAASNYYDGGFESIENLQKVIDCSPDAKIIFTDTISTVSETNKKTELVKESESSIKFTDFNVNFNKNRIILTGKISPSGNIDLGKLLFRADVFDETQNQGLVAIYPVKHLSLPTTKLTNQDSFKIEIISPRFIAMYSNKKTLDFSIVKNAGYSTVQMFNIIHNVADAPKIVYDYITHKEND